MKLYTDSGNFQTLKILAAANTAGVNVEVIDVKPNDKGKTGPGTRLPMLEVSGDEKLFSPNAAVRLLLGRTGKSEVEVDTWLEWESGQLQPVLLPYLLSAVCSEKNDHALEGELRPLLSVLDSTLARQPHLTGDGVSAADIVVYGSLYLLSISKPAQGLLSSLPHLTSWLQRMAALQPVAKAVATVSKGQSNTKTFKESLQSQPLPFPSSSTLSQLFLRSAQPDTGAAGDTGNTEEVERAVSAEERQAAEAAWLAGTSSLPKPRGRKHPILPKEGERNILITSALPYVNNVPHLGNIIGCVLSADVFSRYCRLRNYNVLYICGTDEYGTATETKALAEKLTPQQICDKYHAIHNQIYQWFNIDFDFFGRTTTPHQTKILQDIFWKLYKNGYVFNDTTEQLKCQQCDRFLADRFVEGTCPLCGFEDARGDQCDGCGKLINATDLRNPQCKICRSKPSVQSTKHLFLDLPKVENKLREHLDQAYQTGTWTHNARNITNSWLRDGIKPRCISRDLKWGVPVPLEGYTDKVFYVWFDAPVGYISITANYTEHWEQWWKNPSKVELYNFLGKDNVPFHSVIFPCTLLGTNDNFTIVKHMVATEYLNYEEGKFSKSRETGVFGDMAENTGIPADIYRFYLLYVRPESQDTYFSWDDFLLKNNSELLNNLGNFINRGLMFLANHFGGEVQPMELQPEDSELLALVTRQLNQYIANMEEAKLRDSIRVILAISKLGNQYMQSTKPWVLVKGSEAERRRAGAVVSLCCNISCLLASLLQPYMPATSLTIRQQLAAPPSSDVILPDFVCHLPPGHKIGKPSPLFQKLETALMEELKKKFAGKPAPPAANAKKAPAAAAAPVTPGVKADQVEIDRLTAAVTAQGNKVRELKTAKAEKAVVDAEVAALLDLKRQLALAQGEDPNAQQSQGGKKKGKKK